MNVGSRKFIVTMYFGTACFLLCAFGKMSGGEIVGIVGTLSALYKVSNILDKRYGGRPDATVTDK